MKFRCQGFQKLRARTGKTNTQTDTMYDEFTVSLLLVNNYIVEAD